MRFASCGDAAFIVELGPWPHLLLTRSIAALKAALDRDAPHGYIESVPGLTSLTILFDPALNTRSSLEDDVQRCMYGATSLSSRAAEWRVPVCYSGDFAPDLDEVAGACGLAPAEVIAAHTARAYVVYVVGFSPGFPYLGDVDPRIALPRRKAPRTRVPAGSVAIATQYTAVYPQETAGGWHIIGRTPLRFFDATKSPPSLVAPGDTVRFYSVAAEEFERLERAGPAA